VNTILMKHQALDGRAKSAKNGANCLRWEDCYARSVGKYVIACDLCRVCHDDDRVRQCRPVTGDR